MNESTVNAREAQPQNVAEEPEITRPLERAWLSYREAEIYCGMSRTTLWKLVGERRIKAARVGRAVRLSKESIRQYMESLANDE